MLIFNFLLKLIIGHKRFKTRQNGLKTNIWNKISFKMSGLLFLWVNFAILTFYFIQYNSGHRARKNRDRAQRYCNTILELISKLFKFLNSDEQFKSYPFLAIVILDIICMAVEKAR